MVITETPQQRRQQIVLGTIRRIVEEANELAAAHQLLEDANNNNNDDDAAAVVVDDGPHNLWESAAPAPEEEVYASSCTAMVAKPRERDCDLDSLPQHQQVSHRSSLLVRLRWIASSIQGDCARWIMPSADLPLASVDIQGATYAADTSAAANGAAAGWKMRQISGG